MNLSFEAPWDSAGSNGLKWRSKKVGAAEGSTTCRRINRALYLAASEQALSNAYREFSEKSVG